MKPEDLERILGRLLGSPDPEAAVPGMFAHLQGCPACREEHESLRALVSSEHAP